MGIAATAVAIIGFVPGLVRSNRLVLAQLDAFAHDLFAFLTTGVHFNEVDAANGARGAGPRGVIKGAA